MKHALVNANEIAGNLSTRLDAIRDYLKKIGASGKTIALTTIAPGGGVSTIQTNSKYSFMFDRIGLKYAMPTDFDSVFSSFDKEHPETSVFSMDDNGWFWNIGDGKSDLGNAKTHFTNSADIQILAVRDKEWDGMDGTTKKNLEVIQKTDQTEAGLLKSKVNYDLWNEGLKTPFVLNMILDDLITRIQNKAIQTDVTAQTTKLNAAVDWGDYWTSEFIK